MRPNGLLISAPSSGTGKTTVMLGLLRAFSDRGLAVQPFKSGPDYIDPAFHFAAARRASFNIDSWSMSAELIDAISHQASGAELIIAEGSMGLFDGVATRGAEGYGSSAETAQRLGWPVVLVIDVSGQAQSAAATALGFKTYAPDLNIAGVILNRVASPRHERLARLGMQKAGIEVFGSLPRRGDLALPERHLGLIQAVEHPDLETAVAGYAQFLKDHVDLDALFAAASGSAVGRGAGHPRRPRKLPSRAMLLFLSPIRIYWKAGARQVQAFCRFRLYLMSLFHPLTWSSYPGGIQSCTRASWLRHIIFGTVCGRMRHKTPFMANAAAIWR